MARQDQWLEPQRDAPLADGRERVFEEKVTNNKALQEALDRCREKATSWWRRGWTAWAGR